MTNFVLKLISLLSFETAIKQDNQIYLKEEKELLNSMTFQKVIINNENKRIYYSMLTLKEK